jgi:ribosomal protein S12 methylthiotransferase accessory factor
MRSDFVERMIDLGGTLRSRRASWTLERVQGALARVGITRVANVTGLDHVGVPTWMVVRPLARSLTVSQGKGLNHSLAQISGIMESIEIHHAEHFVPAGSEASLWASVRDDAYVSPLRLPIRSDAVFDEETVCHWIEATDILSGRLRWLPRELIDLDFTARPKAGVFVSSSNGLASGNTPDEAILHGLCEVIERDQVAFWLVRQRSSVNSPSTRINLETVDDADCRWLIDSAAKAGLELVIWYATTNIPIPCFVCLVYDDKGNTCYRQRASGSGCHPYRRIALSRAIAEALQSRLTHISGVRDDVYWSRYRRDLRMDEASTKQWISELQLEPECVNFSDIPDVCRIDTTGQMLSWIVAAIGVAGLSEVIVVDLTQADIGLPVVHVTVPGLETNVRMPLYTPGERMQIFLRELDIL